MYYAYTIIRLEIERSFKFPFLTAPLIKSKAKLHMYVNIKNTLRYTFFKSFINSFFLTNSRLPCALRYRGLSTELHTLL